MKKIIMFFLIVVFIVVGISYMYINYKSNYNLVRKENAAYESYYNKEIYGSDLTSIINKAMNQNSINAVNKDYEGKYTDNDKDSIKIDIKILDNDKIYDMETIYNGGMENFIKYYNQIQFKCSKIDYHSSTGKIKYMLFEQITQ